MKRIFSLFLAFCMFVSCIQCVSVSYANEMNTDSEIVSVNGNEYKYVETCINGKNITRIYNLTENTVDVICYDEFSGKVYLNNEQIAQVENNYSNLNDNVSTCANKYWTLHDKTDKIITWKKAVAAAVLAGIIASVIPKVGPVTVIAKIGLSALSVVASMCVNDSFPSAKRLSKLSVEDFEELGTGYRAKYLEKLAKGVASGEIDLEKIKNLPLEKARKELLNIYGVGIKVANCALLFGFGFYDAFPVDVWMKRVMEYYPDGLPKCFDGIGGIAQQYLFHWARNNL